MSARSDIFQALIDGLGEEKELHVTDVVPSAIEKILHYMYSGEVLGMSIGNAMKVYQAAEIYCMETLKNKCGTLIKKKMNESNICDVLVFSDQLRGTFIKDLAISYLINRKSFLESEAWRRFSERYLKLANEVHLAFIKSIK